MVPPPFPFAAPYWAVGRQIYNETPQLPWNKVTEKEQVGKWSRVESSLGAGGLEITDGL